MKTNTFLLTFLVSIIFYLNTNIVSGENVTLKGLAPSYAGDKISFYSFKDYFSYKKIYWCSVLVNDTGYFECKFNLDETMELFSDLGIFNVFFYAEPENEYNLILPEKTEKESKDKLNPYFEPIEIQLGIKKAQADELNVLIRMFNDAFIPYYNKHVINVVVEKDFSKLDEDIKKLTEPFEEINNEYFKEYIKYRIQLLRFLAQQNKSKGISDEFFNHETIHYNNPAYMELFNQVYPCLVRR